MKIVHIITRLIVGGAQENTLLSCEGQHDLGHEVTLITGPAIGPEGSLMERATRYGYRVIVVDAMRRAISPTKDYATYRELVRLLREIEPDVVHTHSSKAGIVGRQAAHRARRLNAATGVADRRLPPPRQSVARPCVVHTIHGLAFTASTNRFVNGVYKFLERRAAPMTDNIVCVADAMRDQSLAANIGTPDQYVTVYSGMQTQPFLSPPVPREVVRERLGLRPQHIAVGTIARLFNLKGHDDLLDLAPRLCARFENLRFLWIGDGLLRGEFERRIAAMNLTGRFIFTGLVPPTEIPQLANAMDILVHPSRREGLARAIPQGGLAGKPVVTYDIDGNREGLQHGISGYCLPPFDVEKLHDSLAALLTDASLREMMGNAGRAFALSRFDTRVMIEGLERVYATRENA